MSWANETARRPVAVDETGTAPDMAGLAPAPPADGDLTAVLAALRDAAASHDRAAAIRAAAGPGGGGDSRRRVRRDGEVAS